MKYLIRFRNILPNENATSWYYPITFDESYFFFQGGVQWVEIFFEGALLLSCCLFWLLVYMNVFEYPYLGFSFTWETLLLEKLEIELNKPTILYQF